MVYVLEGEDRHLEGEDCKVVVLEATTATLARVRVMKIEPKTREKARCYWACLVMSETNMSLCAKDVLERMLAQSLIACVFKDAGMRLLARPTTDVDGFNALIEVRVGKARAFAQNPYRNCSRFKRSRGQGTWLRVAETCRCRRCVADAPVLVAPGANTIQGLLLMSNPFLAFTLLPLRCFLLARGDGSQDSYHGV